MKQDRLSQLIYKARGKAAQHIGGVYQVFRPAVANDPLTNQVATLNAAFNAKDESYRRPNLPGQAIWFCDLDGNQTKSGYYLVSDDGEKKFFIAGQQPLLPIIAVECNRAVVVSRASSKTSVSGVGAVGYAGISSSNQDLVDLVGVSAQNNNGQFVGWPCSILLGGHGQVSMKLPTDSRNQGWLVMLPPSVPLNLLAGDILTDDTGRRFMIDGAEFSDTGYRLNVQEVHP
jgi:hypothetical protein